MFCPLRYPTNMLYSKFGALRLEDMIDMEFAKFVFKFKNKMLPTSFDKYFTKIANVHNYNTSQKTRYKFYQSYVKTDIGQKKPSCMEKYFFGRSQLLLYKIFLTFEQRCLVKY